MANPNLLLARARLHRQVRDKLLYNVQRSGRSWAYICRQAKLPGWMAWNLVVCGLWEKDDIRTLSDIARVIDCRVEVRFYKRSFIIAGHDQYDQYDQRTIQI